MSWLASQLACARLAAENFFTRRWQARPAIGSPIYTPGAVERRPVGLAVVLIPWQSKPVRAPRRNATASPTSGHRRAGQRPRSNPHPVRAIAGSRFQRPSPFPLCSGRPATKARKANPASFLLADIPGVHGVSDPFLRLMAIASHEKRLRLVDHIAYGLRVGISQVQGACDYGCVQQYLTGAATSNLLQHAPQPVGD